MANNTKNLIPQAHKLTVEDQSAGGKASAESRRKKKLLKDCMMDLLDLPVKSTKFYNKLSRMGINPEDIDNRSLLTVSLFVKAVECGDVAAFKEIRSLIGEDKATDGNGEFEKLLEEFKDL